MGYKVNKTIDVSVFINGVEYQIERNNVLNMLHMSSNVLYRLPQFHMVLTDSTNVIPKYNLADRSSVDITITKANERRVYQFLTHTVLKTDGVAPMYHIDGYWNAPKFWSGTANSTYNGTTSDVIAKIAKECGLSCVVDSTTDNQLWHQRNRTYANFVRYLAQYGFVDNESHMAVGVSLRGILKYLNVRKLKPKVSVVYGIQADKAIEARDYQPSTKSGVSNSINGYADTRIIQSVSNGIITQDSLTFKSNSKKPLINDEVRKKVGQSNLTFSPIDFGNVNPQFEKAKYQNSRFNAITSLGNDFLFDNITVLDLMDQFAFSSNKSKEHDGNYTVTGQVIYIEGDRYAEKFSATKDGLS